jgi:hypothetical protein
VRSFNPIGVGRTEVFMKRVMEKSAASVAADGEGAVPAGEENEGGENQNDGDHGE